MTEEIQHALADLAIAITQLSVVHFFPVNMQWAVELLAYFTLALSAGWCCLAAKRMA